MELEDVGLAFGVARVHRVDQVGFGRDLLGRRQPRAGVGLAEDLQRLEAQLGARQPPAQGTGGTITEVGGESRGQLPGGVDPTVGLAALPIAAAARAVVAHPGLGKAATILPDRGILERAGGLEHHPRRRRIAGERDRRPGRCAGSGRRR